MNIISNSGRGTFYTYAVSGDAYYDADDKLVKYENATVKKSQFINSYNAGTLSFKLDNIDIYAENIIKTNGNGTKALTLDVDKCHFYKTIGSADTAPYGGSSADGDQGCIAVKTTGDNVTLTFDDSLFYIPEATVKAGDPYYTFISVGSASKIHTATFTNCDIISYNNANFGIWEAATANDPTTNTSSVIFNGCRIYGIKKIPRTNGDVYNPTVGAGTVSTDGMVADGNADFAEGCVRIDKIQSISYSLPNISKVSVDSNGKANLNFDFGEHAVTFTKKVGLESDLAEVKWLDLDGNVLATSQEFKGDTASIPASIAEIEKFPTGNGYTAFTNDPVWINAENEKDFTVTSENTSFTASLPENPDARPANLTNTQTVYTIDTTFDDYVASLQYALHESGRVSFGVTMSEGFLDYKAELVGTGFSKKIEATKDGDGNVLSYTYYTRDRAFDVLINDCVINIKDANGTIVATQTYNIATYASGMVTDAAKALAASMFDLGESIKEVRAYLNNL